MNSHKTRISTFVINKYNDIRNICLALFPFFLGASLAVWLTDNQTIEAFSDQQISKMLFLSALLFFILYIISPTIKSRILLFHVDRICSILNENSSLREEFHDQFLSIFNESFEGGKLSQEGFRSEIKRFDTEKFDRILNELDTIKVDNGGQVSERFRTELSNSLSDKATTSAVSQFSEELFRKARRRVAPHPHIEVLDEFVELDWNDREKSTLLTILEKYTKIWEGGEELPPARIQRTQLIRDRIDETKLFQSPVDEWFESRNNPTAWEDKRWRDDTIPNFVPDLLSHPYFLRLMFINQLSTTFLWQDPEATHNRWNHSIGVLKRSILILECLESNEEIDIPDLERDAVCLYALIHDMYHGPFGHSLELMRYSFPIPDDIVDKKLDKAYLYKELREESSLTKALEDSLENPQRLNPLREYMIFFIFKEGFLDDPAEIDFEFNHLTDADTFAKQYYLAEIVDSQIDADRLDYIVRDCLQIGDEIGVTKEELTDMISNIDVKQMEREGDVTPVNRLCFSKDDKTTIYSLLDKRNNLYNDIYKGGEKIAIDEMIIHALYWTLDHYGVEFPLQGDESKEIMDTVTMLTDYQLLDFLSSFNQPMIVNELARGILAGSFYTEISDRENSDEKFKFSPSNQDKRETRKQLSRNPTQSEIEELTQEWGLNDLLPLLTRECGQNFRSKLFVERRFWDRLKDSDEFTSTITRYDVPSDRLPEKPRIFISFPSFDDVREANEEHKVNFDSLFWCDGDLESVPFQREEVKIVLCGPRWMDIGEIKEIILGEFESYVKEIKPDLACDEYPPQ